jgi:hypothetical protein
MSLNLEAIQSQAIAVGLVENPCCWALRDLASQVPADQVIVELGAFKGRSTGWLALGASNGNGAHVYSVDPHEQGSIPDGYADHAPSVPEYVLSETRAAYLAHIERTGIGSLVTPVQATAVQAAKDYDGPKVGLLWHDALHEAKNVADDLRAWMPHMAEKAVIVLHDVGDPRLGVEEGASRVLTTKARAEVWEWEGREIHLWAKQPTRRGYLIVRTR